VHARSRRAPWRAPPPVAAPAGPPRWAGPKERVGACRRRLGAASRALSCAGSIVMSARMRARWLGAPPPAHFGSPSAQLRSRRTAPKPGPTTCSRVPAKPPLRLHPRVRHRATDTGDSNALQGRHCPSTVVAGETMASATTAEASQAAQRATKALARRRASPYEIRPARAQGASASSIQVGA